MVIGDFTEICNCFLIFLLDYLDISKFETTVGSADDCELPLLVKPGVQGLYLLY